eukprot:755206-Hanusia_phi.AAC.1
MQELQGEVARFTAVGPLQVHQDAFTSSCSYLHMQPAARRLLALEHRLELSRRHVLRLHGAPLPPAA